MSELEALRKYKKTLDIGFTAVVLGMQHEFGGTKLSCQEALAEIQAVFRQAEKEFQNTTREYMEGR